MKNIRIFLSENFHFSVVKFSVDLNRLVFVMDRNFEPLRANHSVRSRGKMGCIFDLI